MPNRPPRACPRCGAVVPAHAPCPDCSTVARRNSDQTRGSAAARGYDRRHRARFRRAVLTRDPICVICRVRVAVVADHYPLGRDELVAAGLDPYDAARGRGLCKPCDSAQTARRQPGGWNRRP